MRVVKLQLLWCVISIVIGMVVIFGETIVIAIIIDVAIAVPIY